MELLPWLVCICKMYKNHISAWLNCVASYHINDFNNFNCMNYKKCSELEFAVYAVAARNNKNTIWLKNACGIDSKVAYNMYKFINESTLVYHVWQLNKRRSTLKNNALILDKTQTFNVDVLLQNKVEFPEMWYDRHTLLGKKMGRGFAHFFSILELNPKMELENDYEEEGKAICLASETIVPENVVSEI